MRIYVDSVSVYTVSAGAIDTSLPMSNGTHAVNVQAWDTSGAVFVQAITVIVGSSGTPTGIPANATLKSQIQAIPNWGTCNKCAGIGANGPLATSSMVENQLSPSLSGKSAKFSMSGQPFADVIWWQELGAANAATHFQYDVDFYLTTPQYAFALEFDTNQTVNSRRFVFGTQCGVNYDHQWDVWDTLGNHWKPTGIPCAIPTAFQWHHLTWEYYRDASAIHYVAVTVDGVKHFVNAAYSSKAWSNSPELNIAFQMDGDSVMHPYSVWIDNARLAYW